MSPEELRFRLNPLLSLHDVAVQQVKQEKQQFRDKKQQVVALQEAQSIVQAVAEEVQRSAHAQISAVVTRCLRAIWGEESYEFKILWEKKRGRTEAVLVLERDGLVLDDPINEAGGGVIDCAGFALRLACIMLSRPKLRRLAVLDEPMKHLSRDRRPLVLEMLKGLSKEFGFQFLLVTHDPVLAVGNVVEL